MHTRELHLDADTRTLHLVDTVTSEGMHELQWSFPLSGGSARAEPGRASIEFPDGLGLVIEAADLTFAVESGWVSPSYGRRVEVPFVRIRKRSGTGQDVTDITLRWEAPATAPGV